MQQTAHRHTLGATPKRPSVGTPRAPAPLPLPMGRSRVQPTAFLIANYAQGVAGLSSTPQAPIPMGRSRVQPTAYLLSHFSQGAPSAAPARPPQILSRAARAGMAGAATSAVSHGLGAVGASWLTQGVVLAAAAEFIRTAFEPPKSDIEKAAELAEAAKKVDNPFQGAGIAGNDRYITVDSPLSGVRGMGIVPPAAISAPAIASGGANAGWLAAAGGPIGIGVAAVTFALSALMSRQRPARKVATTQIVDEVEPLIQKNLTDYMAGPRTVTSQQQALNNFDAAWSHVRTNCGDPAMGKPGQWCIDDRKRGGQWDWFARYRDPIENDPTVIPDPGPDYSTSVDPVTGERIYTEAAGSLNNMAPLLLALGLGAVALMMGGSK